MGKVGGGGEGMCLVAAPGLKTSLLSAGRVVRFSQVPLPVTHTETA